MNITFSNRELEAACTIERQGNRLWGKPIAKRVRRFFKMLAEEPDLTEIVKMRSVNLHELKGGQAGRFAMYVTKAFRIVFVPTQDPIPERSDGSIDVGKLTDIEIIFIGDYH